MSEANLPARKNAPLPTRRASIPDPIAFADVRDLSQQDLHARGVQLVRAFQQVENVQVVVLKSLAAVLVSLRLHMDDPTGDSHEYKQAAADIYRDAGVPKDTKSHVQGNVRWHIGNLLRKVLPPAEVQALGLKAEGPAERKALARSVTRALVTAHRAGETLDALTPPVVVSAPKKSTTRKKAPAAVESPVVPVGRAVADHLRLAESVGQILGRMQDAVITNDMTPGQRGVLVSRLRDAVARAEELIKVAEEAATT
ncbi:hypothetical protein ATKI12_6968 [Kitasatospora sp. Ki12]